MRIGIFANLTKPGTRELLRSLERIAGARNLDMSVDCESIGGVSPLPDLPCESFGEQMDVVLTLGGDGTLLRAVRRMGAKPAPVLGINSGKLGFLTTATQNAVDDVIEELLAGSLRSSKRDLLRCTYRKADGSTGEHHGLNDVVFSWGASSHIAHLDVQIDELPLTTYTCDGLIVSSPTGSTGHSLSAGGPILHPATPALVLSPICPHSMTVRPLVLPQSTRIRVRPHDLSKTLVLAVDGKPVVEIGPKDEASIESSDRNVILLQRPDHSYWHILRSKLHWRGSHVQ